MSSIEFNLREPKQGIDPKLFVMYGVPKVGKSTVCSQLKGALILDLNREYDHLSGLIVECATVEDLSLVKEKILKEKKHFPYIIIDNITWLCEMVKPFAVK